MADRMEDFGPETRRAAAAPSTRHEFVVRALILAAILCAIVAAWELRTVILLLFAAMLAGVLFDGIAARLVRQLGWSRRVALTAAVLFTGGTFVVLSLAFGSQLQLQASQLVATLPQGIASLRAAMAEVPLLGAMAGSFHPDWSEIAPRLIGSVASTTTAAIGGLVLATVGGIYLAAQPRLYRRMLIALTPRRQRPRVARTLDRVVTALHHWLVGQLLVMLFVGTFTGLGAWAIGLPSPLALGMIAGLLEFVPYAGPFLTVIPALLLASTMGVEVILLTLLLLFSVQQVEGYVLTPLVQRRVTKLPPLITLFAIFAAGSLFGALGVLLAVPLAVVVYTALSGPAARGTRHG